MRAQPQFSHLCGTMIVLQMDRLEQHWTGYFICADKIPAVCYPGFSRQAIGRATITFSYCGFDSSDNDLCIYAKAFPGLLCAACGVVTEVFRTVSLAPDVRGSYLSRCHHGCKFHHLQWQWVRTIGGGRRRKQPIINRTRSAGSWTPLPHPTWAQNGR